MHQRTGLSYFPTLSNEEVMNLLAQRDLFILPSLKEGFPVAAVEAMKAGLVPLVTNWDGATEEKKQCFILNQAMQEDMQIK